MRKHNAVGGRAAARLVLGLCVLWAIAAVAQVKDPGVRKTSADGQAPAALPGLTAQEMVFFEDGLARFMETDMVTGGEEANNQGNGLGPRFNSNQCSSCHLQPFVGGSSPAINPLYDVVNANGATNQMPWFIAPNGPIREARFVQSNGAPDGGVHDLFVITGRTDAPSRTSCRREIRSPGWVATATWCSASRPRSLAGG
jgi:hypothetical protein